jgi:hypothetical protein
MDASTLYYLSKFANNYTNMMNGGGGGGGGSDSIIDNNSIVAMDAYLRSLYSIASSSSNSTLPISSSLSTCSTTSSSESSTSTSPASNKTKIYQNLNKNFNDVNNVASKGGFSIADILGTTNKNLQIMNKNNNNLLKPKPQQPSIHLQQQLIPKPHLILSNNHENILNSKRAISDTENMSSDSDMEEYGNYIKIQLKT